MWRWPVIAPTNAPNSATLTPAGCPASLPPPARCPRTPPSCPPLCLTRRWTGRSSWWPTAAPSPWRQRSVGREVAAAAVPKWPTCGSWRPTAVPTQGAETRPVKTVGWRRSHWARGWSTTQPPLQPARPPRGRSTCEGAALHLNHPPDPRPRPLPLQHPPSLLATTCPVPPPHCRPLCLLLAVPQHWCPFLLFITASTVQGFRPSPHWHRRHHPPLETNQM